MLSFNLHKSTIFRKIRKLNRPPVRFSLLSSASECGLISSVSHKYSLFPISLQDTADFVGSKFFVLLLFGFQMKKIFPLRFFFMNLYISNINIYIY